MKRCLMLKPASQPARGLCLWAVSTPPSLAGTDFVNSIYSYTDESDAFTPGCNMLFGNFYWGHSGVESQLTSGVLWKYHSQCEALYSYKPNPLLYHVKIITHNFFFLIAFITTSDELSELFLTVRGNLLPHLTAHRPINDNHKIFHFTSLKLLSLLYTSINMTRVRLHSQHFSTSLNFGQC